MIVIYSIRCLINNRVYVGASSNFRRRKEYHWERLANICHDNPELQEDYNCFGEAGFSIDIIETCEKEHSDEREQCWIDYYGGVESDSTYNLRGGGSGKLSIKTKNKIKENHADVSGENNPNFGKRGPRGPQKNPSGKPSWKKGLSVGPEANIKAWETRRKNMANQE